jgi:hypothetical protein
MSVELIDTAAVRTVLDPIWLKIPETASRVRNRIELILDAAKASGLRNGDNPARWAGHLNKLLPPGSKLWLSNDGRLPVSRPAWARAPTPQVNDRIA